jgi:hypothetical protein
MAWAGLVVPGNCVGKLWIERRLACPSAAQLQRGPSVSVHRHGACAWSFWNAGSWFWLPPECHGQPGR